MSFDIPNLHIPDASPEGRLIEQIVSRDHVSPEEAVRLALRSIAFEASSAVEPTAKKKLPGELLFGMFADEPELMRKISDDARKARDHEVVEGHGA